MNWVPRPSYGRRGHSVGTWSADDAKGCDVSLRSLSVLAGTVSTTIFVISYLPMLLKALRTRDLRSYSSSNLVLANVGNGVHSVYVFSLPPGPIWALHSFYLVSTALMLAWYVRYTRSHLRRRPEESGLRSLARGVWPEELSGPSCRA